MAKFQMDFSELQSKIFKLLGEYGINGENLGIEIECSSKFSELMSLAHHESVEEQNLFKNTIKKILNNNQNLNELRDPSQNIRYYTLAGADAAITKMKERDPDWELKMKKIF